MVRSAGQVRYWPPEAIHALVALVEMYAMMMQRCPPPLPASALAGGGAPSVALSGALVQLLVRKDLLELLAEALRLVHFDAAFSARCQRHEIVGSAVAVWGFLRDLVRFAGARSDAVAEQRKCRDLGAGVSKI